MDNRERIADFEESFRMALDGFRMGLWTALPGIVADASKVATQQTVDIRPMIPVAMLSPQGKVTVVPLPILRDCPVVWQGGGGYTLTFPIAKGDEALVVFASRCIDAWWQNGGSTPLPPPDLRFHDLSDGFAYIGPRDQQRTLSNISTTKAQLRSDDGDEVIELGEGVINITTTGNVGVTAGGNASVTAAGIATIKATAIKLQNAGSALLALINSNFVALFNNHVHPDPQGGNTGTPTTPITSAMETTVLTAE